MIETSEQAHVLPSERIMATLGVDERGLAPEEAARRLAAGGPNRIEERRQVPTWRRFLRQFTSPLVYVLLVAALLSWFIGERWDPYVILGIVLVNALIGYFQESRAEHALAALRRMTSPQAKVIRGAHTVEVPASEVVVGDVLVLEAGDRVAADARLLHCHQLAIDESTLTGESQPVEKSARTLEDRALPLGDRLNMAYMNTSVTAGRAHAVVVATGMATEMGAIAREVSGASTLSPLQRRFEGLSRAIGAGVLVVVTAVLALGVVRGLAWGEMIMVALSLAVSVIPEGLPIVVSTLLAIGVWRMARQRALIRHLPAVEALGSATVIGSDKTGTLTQNQMTVQRLFVGGVRVEVKGEGYRPEGELRPEGEPDSEALFLLLAGAALCNDALLAEHDGAWEVVGDPTEGALQTLALKAGFQEDWPRVDEIPFSSERRWMVTVHERPDGTRIGFIKGAFEALSALSEHELADGATRPLDAPMRARWAASADELARDALRVLAIGLVEHAAPGLEPSDLRGKVTLLGLVGMRDPERPEAVRAIETARAAGIRVVMITGDHRRTAEAVARRLGLLQAGEQVVDGTELDRYGEPELRRDASHLAVYARVSPEHKLRIVRALQDTEQIVAMTGDGVNDAPALAQADIGIAMGRTGTEVAKGAADMVLADDNFATIVAAIREGRAISANLRKVLMYLFATNAGEVLVLAGAVALGMPLPVTAVQILWLNLVTDGTIDKTYAAEPPEAGLMREPPRPRNAPLITVPMLGRIGWVAGWMALACLALFAWELRAGPSLEHARTMAFTTLATTQWMSALAFRSEGSVFRVGLTSNPWLLGGIALSALLQALVVYLPPMQAVFGTVPLDAGELGRCVLAGLALLGVTELAKAPWSRP